LPLVERVVGLEGTASYQRSTTLLCKKGSELSLDRQILYENQVLWLLQLQRLAKAPDQNDENSLAVRVHALDHFVRREVAKKMSEERELDDAEAQVYNLPFKMKV